MKKKLESELISIAHRILKLKEKEDVINLHAEVSDLYEKLSVLKFVHEKMDDETPSIGNDSSFFGMLDDAFNNKVSDTIEVEDKIYINLDDAEEDPIMEPVMEKIKDMVAHMPQEVDDIDTIIEDILPKPTFHKNDFEDITAGFQEMPIFEPVSKTKNGKIDEKKSLNDNFKSGRLNIGLNDKLAFIKHLFDGKHEDYDRVISQINTSASFNDAKLFITEMVKPDYNNWEGKEEFEERLIEIIESKFL